MKNTVIGIDVGGSTTKIVGFDYSSGERKLINKARLVMVALDENDRPTPVPRRFPTLPVRTARSFVVATLRRTFRRRKFSIRIA